MCIRDRVIVAATIAPTVAATIAPCIRPIMVNKIVVVVVIGIRHPVPTGSRARVSGSYSGREVRGHCGRGGARLSRHLHVHRRANAQLDFQRDAEDGKARTGETPVDEVAEKLEVYGNSYDRTPVCRFLSSTEHIVDRYFVV